MEKKKRLIIGIRPNGDKCLIDIIEEGSMTLFGEVSYLDSLKKEGYTKLKVCYMEDLLDEIRRIRRDDEKV